MHLPHYPYLFLLCCASLFAQSVEAKHARVELIAESTGVTPGHKLLLGAHFQLEKDWHLYWINPGDSGQPPVIHWQLPSGFSAGEAQWPRPEKLKSSQSADYVYKDDLLLMVPVEVLSSFNSKSPVDLDADVNWLICREICLADRARLHLALLVSSNSSPDPRHAQLFNHARQLLPRAWPTGWKATATSNKDAFILSIKSGTPLREAEFFPLELSQVDNGAPQPLRATAQGAKITLKKSEQLVKPVSKLRGLLVMRDGHAYEIIAPVVQQ
jgi:thiol:disulfide interchange protein DsbD